MTTEQRVLKALAKWEADRAAEGRTCCEACDNWHRGAECPACEPGPMVRLVSLIGIAMTVTN